MPAATRPVPVGLRLIVGYKIIKATALFVSAGFLFFSEAGVAAELQTIALELRNRASAAWSVALARWLLDAATARNLHVIALAFLLDGALSGVEGWALYRRFAWSGWLVVIATSALLPFEGIAMVRHFSAWRVLIAAANLLIVLYLIRLTQAGPNHFTRSQISLRRRKGST